MVSSEAETLTLSQRKGPVLGQDTKQSELIYIHSCLPHCRGCLLRPQWMPETTGRTKPDIWCIFFCTYIAMAKFNLYI